MFVCYASWLYDNVILEMMGWIVLYVLDQFLWFSDKCSFVLVAVTG